MRDLDEILMVEPFTEREIQILTLMEQGCSNKDISEKLYITLDTVKWYNKRIYSKLGVQSRTQAIARARSMRLLDMGHDKPTEQGAVARHNLPLQLTSFIGRQKVIEDIQTFLHDKRLITLCGPPGTGK